MPGEDVAEGVRVELTEVLDSTFEVVSGDDALGDCVDDSCTSAVAEVLGSSSEDVGFLVTSGPESEVAVGSASPVSVGREELFVDVIDLFCPRSELSALPPSPKLPPSPRPPPMFEKPDILE